MALEQMSVFPVQLKGFDRATAPPITRHEVEFYFEDGFLYPRRGKLHHAIDIRGPAGLLVVSSTNGAVAREWYLDSRRYQGTGYGNDAGHFVVIVDELGYFHHYAHLHEGAIVSPGDRVYAGQRLGLVGMSGNAQGPHLHYQVRDPGIHQPSEYSSMRFSGQGGNAVDPYDRLVDLAVRQLGAQRQPGTVTGYMIPIP
jgi:murein DD-endopeptidase MepM/ murein hydrolase activator NlpD